MVWKLNNIMAQQVSFFYLTFLLYTLAQAASEVYHITTHSTLTDRCTAPCLTLSEFITNSSHRHCSNISLVFLPGTHHLKVNMLILDCGNFSMISMNTTAQIVCKNSHIHFKHSQHISMSNLEFIGCGGNVVEHVEEFIVKDTKFNGQNNSGTALEIIKTIVQIINATFELHRQGKWTTHPSGGTLGKGFFGGVIIAINCKINISQSIFKNYGANFGGAIFAQQHSIITIHNSSFTYSSAMSGGALLSLESNVTIVESEFDNNTAKYGGVLYSTKSNITIVESEFDNNIAEYVGELHSQKSNITIVGSEFDNNTAKYGGVLCSLKSNVTIVKSEFDNNTAEYGGVLHSKDSNVTIVGSEFDNNTAEYGGVLYSVKSNVTTVESEFDNNIAEYVGVLHSQKSNVTIIESEFDNNTAKYGGVLYSTKSNVTLVKSEFDNNTAEYGGVLYSQESNVKILSLQIVNNRATNALIYLIDSELNVEYSGSLLVSNNVGSLLAFNSNITFTGGVEFVSNYPKQSETSFQEGGAITLFQSNAYFNGSCSLQYNHAENGGGLLSTESKLYVYGNVTIAHNTATRNGGGVYLSNSELICPWKSTFVLHNNYAEHKGGGLHAAGSSIKTTSAYYSSIFHNRVRLNFINNVANMGGGLSLEANAKLYILMHRSLLLNDVHTVNTLAFTANNALSHGGAVYVDDETNSATCASTSNTECFLQVLIIGQYSRYNLRTKSICFSHNQANGSGSTLYGGLLDRCTVSQFAKVRIQNNIDDGLTYFNNIAFPGCKLDQKKGSTATNISISSGPVKVCLCINNEHNFSHQAHIEVEKGETFNVSLVAVDQIEQPVNATIQATLKFPQSGLSKGQLTTEIQGECTHLTFNVVSPHRYETLTLYASDGPCKDAKLSRRAIEIHFRPCSCPIGFQVRLSRKNETNCTCDCHSNIGQYTKRCDSQTGSFIKKFQSRIWISFINNSKLDGYLVYPNCPFDYCLSTSPPINLNHLSGADDQCAFNRSSLLYGSCQPDFSLSLGSSRCLHCPSYWPVQLIAITVAAILAGIALVAILLVLNMTVAVGTLNGLIFYANVVHANKSILLPFRETNLVTVFISWLNLDLGVDTCYFPGMDTYVKTWLQLAFPAYVILLVGLVIIVSSYSIRFSKLIGKKDPVATLATLILLSYAKVLEICFESLSVGMLKYPDGTSEPLWLPDATVRYLSEKHIPLFVAAILTLLVGLVYTALIFLWQWLLCLPNWKPFRWTRDQKLQTFIETHHAPFTPKYRYWTGLLLIVRTMLYLIAAVNVSNDPQLALSAISFTVSCIFFFRSYIQGKVYKKSPVDVLEIFFSLNLLIFSIFTWYSLSNSDHSVNQKAVAYISVITAFFVLLLIILYHVYTYTTVFSTIKKTRSFRMTRRLLTRSDQEMRRHLSLPPDDNIHRFNELLDIFDRPINTDDYRVPLLRPKPTQSVVEVHQPYLPPPEPEPVNTHNVPGDAKVDQVNVDQREKIRETQSKV